MRVRFWKALRVTIFAWGCLSLAGALVLAAFIGWQCGPGNRTRDDAASLRDVRFVLNWCGLGDQRAEKVTHSHISARSFTGDYLDAYAIAVTHVDAPELASVDDEDSRWYRGDQLPQSLSDAVHFVSGWRSEIPWFPSEQELRSSQFYIYSWEVVLHGTRATAAQLIFVRPSDKMVFYLGGKT